MLWVRLWKGLFGSTSKPPKRLQNPNYQKSKPPECSILFNASYSEQYAVCTVQVDVPYHYRLRKGQAKTQAWSNRLNILCSFCSKLFAYFTQGRINFLK